MAEYQYAKADVVRRYLRTGQLQGVLLDGAWRPTLISSASLPHHATCPQVGMFRVH